MEMTKQAVGAGIYSTATGQLVVYDEGELVGEWARLKTIAPDQFTAEINRNESDRSSESLGQLEFADW
jgi:hypothetical protein